MVAKANIMVRPELCTECLSCQLVCSITYCGEFNPARARIAVAPRPEPGGMTAISFTDSCIPNCSLCARYCPSKALTPLKKAKA